MFENVLFGILSILVIVGVSFLLSENKKAINWRGVAWGIGIDIILLLFFTFVPIGIDVLNGIAYGFNKFISFGNEAIAFVIGKQLMSGSAGFFFGTVLLPIVYVVSAIYIAYKIKLIPLIIKICALTIGKLTKYDGISVVLGVGNFFLAGSESPLFVKPYINDKMTRSQMFSLCLTGFGSTCLSILPAYHSLGIPSNDLILVSILQICTSLVISKIIVPETEEVESTAHIHPSEEKSVTSAMTHGALKGMEIAIAVASCIIAVLGLLYFVNYLLGFVHLSLSEIFGWIFYPFMRMFGLDSANAHMLAGYLATKTYTNEFVAFMSFGKVIATLPHKVGLIGVSLITSFANVSVVGITLGSLSAFTNSEKLLTMANKLVWKALLGGILAGLLLTGIIVLI